VIVAGTITVGGVSLILSTFAINPPIAVPVPAYYLIHRV